MFRFKQCLSSQCISNVSSLPSRYYKLSVVLLCFLVPTWVPWFLWDESLWVGYFVPCLMRYALVLNATWLVNSAAHMWGNRPYDRNINPSENRFVAFSAIGKAGSAFSLKGVRGDPLQSCISIPILFNEGNLALEFGLLCEFKYN